MTRRTMIDVLNEEPRVYPIPIRRDVTVRIFDLPADLTQAEADKIAAVVKALASPSHEDEGLNTSGSGRG